MAVILPVLILTIVGMTEVAFFASSYLDALDLTREAARFASQNEIVEQPAIFYDCSHLTRQVWDPVQQADVTVSNFDFWFETACIFSPPSGSGCPDATFCNGFNPYIPLDLSAGMDDVVIEAFTISSHHANQVFPAAGYWALSNRSTPTDSWKTDCHGHNVQTQPYYTLTRVNQYLQTDANTPGDKGYVAVEFYYCYHQVLDLPIISNLIPNPLRMHVYTLMPLPFTAPTATPAPSAAP